MELSSFGDKNCSNKASSIDYMTIADLSSHGQAGSAIMKDWILVAAGIERYVENSLSIFQTILTFYRFFFFVYSLAFAFVSGFYI